MLIALLAIVAGPAVLPGPPSGPIQPPGMICLGACAGPVIYGAAERGRLVVACDMRSSTCSDGRKITTTRATPVPCEVAPGVWEIVPADQGCYSVRGLDAWAQNTSYLSWGAELDRGAWGSDSAAVQKLAHGYRVTGDGAASRVFQVIPPDAGTWTFACVADTGASIGARLRIYQEGGTGSVFCNLDSTPGYRTHSCTTTVTGTPTGMSVHVYPGTGYIDVAGCWLTKTATPGRPCWGGEAPVTCARDFHRLPATGFPATTGEISWVMRLERVPEGGDTLRGIVWADGAPVPNRLSLTEGGAIRVNTGETAYVTEPLSWEPGRSYAVRLIMAEDEWRVVRDGALVGSTPPLGSMDWRTIVRVGDLLDGSISSLRVRSFE